MISSREGSLSSSHLTPLPHHITKVGFKVNHLDDDDDDDDAGDDDDNMMVRISQ